MSSGGVAGSKTKPPSAGASSGGAPIGEPSSGGAPTEPGTGGVVEPGIGGSPDPISFGGAPTYLDECAPDLLHVLPRPEFECPAEIGNDMAPCDIPENAACVWQVIDLVEQRTGYGFAGCYATLTGTRWRNYVIGEVGPAGENGEHCPDWLPEAGSSCSGHAGEICYYPAVSCSCAGDSEVWACEPDPGMPGNPPLHGLPLEVQRLCPPEGLDESKQIKDLTEAEVLTWCNWHGDPSGEPRPEVIDDRGSDGYATWGFNIGYELCLPQIPVELCVRNFRALPECTATLGDLDDCVETIRGSHQNERPAWVGHGCVPLLTHPSCEGLIVSDDCVLPLD